MELVYILSTAYVQHFVFQSFKVSELIQWIKQSSCYLNVDIFGKFQELRELLTQMGFFLTTYPCLKENVVLAL